MVTREPSEEAVALRFPQGLVLFILRNSRLSVNFDSGVDNKS